MKGCFGKSACKKTKSPSPSPRKSPAGRKHVGFTRWTGNPVFLQPNGKMTLANNRTQVFYIKNKNNSSHNGLYSANDAKVLYEQLRVPNWNFQKIGRAHV